MSEFQKVQAEKDQSRLEAGGKCKFCSQILKLPKPKLKSFYEAMMLEKETVTNETILDVLVKWNLDVSKTAVDNHRRGYSSLGGGKKFDSYATHMLNIKKAAGLNG